MEKFRHMRLSDNQISDEEAKKMLQEASHGVMALQTKGGYPVTIPVNFVYDGNKILFHGAKEGQKYELIQENPMCSFCVIAKDDIRPEYITSLYESTIAFGKVKEITDEDKKMDCLLKILDKYMPQVLEEGKEYMKGCWDDIGTFEIEIEHLTGKKGTA